MGERTERKLAALFSNNLGWEAQRAAASGSATDSNLPDVTFGHGGVGIAAEEKTTSDGVIYVRQDEIDGLKAYADAYGMTPAVIGRFKQSSPSISGTDRSPRAYYVWHPRDMLRTDAGKYRGAPGDYAWSLRLRAPDSPANGVVPGELSGSMVRHALVSEITGVSNAGWENDAIQGDNNE